MNLASSLQANPMALTPSTAALRYELGDDHSYDFVNGVVPWETDRGVPHAILP